ncbi:MAG: hypothetical protein K9I85_16295 [Saprospiraceae bacterium]|nr:hypothetical protein [Saprospiraceae bacterium]
MAKQIPLKRLNSALFIGLLGLYSVTLSAQEDPVSRYLAAQTTAPEVQMAEELAGFLATHPPTMSWIDKLEFRTETSNFDLSQQEYVFRLSPSSLTAKNRQSDLVGVMNNQYALQTREAVHASLVRAYEQLIDLYATDRQIALNKEALEIENQHLAVLGQIGQVDGADLKDLLQIEEDRQQRMSQLHNLERARKIQERPINGSVQAPTTEALSTYLWISEDQMAATISNSQPVTTPEILIAQSKLDAVNMEQRVEKAEREKVLDFVQSRYQQDPKDPFRQEFSVSLGVNIPYSKAGNVKRQELALEQLESEQKITNIQRETIQQLNDLRLEFELLRQQKQREEEQWESSFLKKMETGALPGLSAEPLLILEAKIARIKYELRILDLEKNATKVYVQWLDLSGKLSEWPLVNYLHVLRPTF